MGAADELASLERERIAHVMRRCGFGPSPGAVAQWADKGADALIDALLANDEYFALADDELFDGIGSEDMEDNRLAMFRFMIQRMIDTTNALHERMTWYWQTHFTTSVEASELRYAWRNYHLIRRHALGNFVELTRAITIDPAMLFYLDGAHSYGDNPNENYSRELLELFTLGVDGGYGEDDVRAAARILAGWRVDWDTGEVAFDEATSYTRPVTFMGERRHWDVDSFIAFVCAQPACHRHVATRLYHHLVGPDLSGRRRDELAAAFATSGLDIKALVAEIVRGPEFLESIHGRSRQPIEWAVGALQAMGHRSVEEVELEPWHLDSLGQTPYYPPNVAGWPLDDRWTTPSQIVARTNVLLNWELAPSTVNSVVPTVDDVLDRCGIYAPSESTRAALDEIEANFSEYDHRLELLFATALNSPEFTLL